MSGILKELFATWKDEKKHLEDVHDYHNDLADERMRIRREESNSPFSNH